MRKWRGHGIVKSNRLVEKAGEIGTEHGGETYE